MPNAAALARHALGLDSQRTSYRNRYYCHPGTLEHAEWMRMVENGDAELGLNYSGRSTDMFALTRKGAQAALRPGESLDPEDFPPLEAA